MPATVALTVPVVVEVLGEGKARVSPLAARSWMTHGRERDALAELRRVLEERLENAAPAFVAALTAHAGPNEHAIRPVGVELPIFEHALHRHLIEFHTVVLGRGASHLALEVSWAARQAHPHVARRPLPQRYFPDDWFPPGVPSNDELWVAVPILGIVFLVPPDVPVRDEAALDARIQKEIARVVAATVSTGLDAVALLPPTSTRIERLECKVKRPEALDAEGRARAARAGLHAAEARRHEEKRELLERLGRPLTGAPLPVGRSEELASLERILGSRDRLGVLVHGPELVGKSALIEHALGRGGRPAYAIPLARFLSDGAFGGWQTVVEQAFGAASLLDAVLYIEDLGSLSLERPDSPIDLGSAIAPFLESHRVRFVGEVRDDELDRFEERNRRLSGALVRCPVRAMSAQATVHVLEQRMGEPGAGAERAFTRGAIDALVPLVERYLPGRALPGNALRAAVAIRDARPAARDEAGRAPEITLDEATHAFADRVGLPSALVRRDLPMPTPDIARALGERVIGQNHAVELVARTLGVVKAELPPPGRPIATFLFVGPTGTGKTELARALATYLFGRADALARFDMSELTDPWAVDRLIRGTDREDGLLTRRVRERPFSVLLLDELEKAHPAAFDLLLQLLGEGRLTDARGKTAHFTSTIIVMTSNLGSQDDREGLGFSRGDGELRAQRDARYLRAVEEHFRPELLNRIDRIVPFGALTEAEALEVARIFVGAIARRRGLSGRRLALDVDEAALAQLATGVLRGGGGARALRRTLEDTLVVGLARLIAKEPRERRTIRVTLASGDVGPGSIEHAGLSFGMTSPIGEAPMPVHRDARAQLDHITGLRRTADRRCRLSAVTSARSEVLRLVAELARSRGEGGHQAAAAEGRLRHLEQLLGPIDEHRRALYAVEEQALSAFDAGQKIAGLAAQAEEAHAALTTALIQAIRRGADDEYLERTIVVLHRSTAALSLFLAPILAWDRLCPSLHLPAGIAPSRPTWPERNAFGPDLLGAEAHEVLETRGFLRAPLWLGRAPTAYLTVDSIEAALGLQPFLGLIRLRLDGANHDLLLAHPLLPPNDPKAVLPDVTAIPTEPAVLVDLDAGQIVLAKCDPIALPPPDGSNQPSWLRALGHLHLVWTAREEGL